MWVTLRGWFSAVAAWLQTPTAKNILAFAEAAGKLTIVVGILSYIVEAPDRSKQHHYQAWQLINGARPRQGKPDGQLRLAC